MVDKDFKMAVDAFVCFEQMLHDENLGDYDIETIAFQKETLKEYWDKVRKAYENICNSLKDDVKVKDLHASYMNQYKAHTKCINLLAKAKRKFKRDEDKTISNSAAQKNTGLYVQPCEVHIFDGDYNAWPTFRDLFTAIYIQNDRLSEVEKLCYLLQKTKGEAREVNRNVAITGENFDTAWRNLKVRYENKRVLFNNQLHLLYGMTFCKEESPEEIKRLQREINNISAILKSYKINVEAWESLFVFHCSIRLPETSLQLWEQAVENKTEIPLWKEFDEFLTDRFRALESVASIRSRAAQNGGSNEDILNSKQKKVQTHHMKTSSFKCILCKLDHEISHCRKFLALDYQNKITQLKKGHYCFNCLKTGHGFWKCPIKNNCSKCTKKHHSLIHREDRIPNTNYRNLSSGNRENQGGQGPRVENLQSTSNNSLSNNFHNSVSRKVMLATALVQIKYWGGNFTARALIDPCSDESFICKRLLNLLNLPSSEVSAEVSGLGGQVVGRIDKKTTFQLISKKESCFSVQVTALVVPQVTGRTPTHSFNPLKDLPKLEYADPNFYESSSVDLLLGGDVYPAILKEGVLHGICNSLVAQETVFGWVVTGPAEVKQSRSVCMLNRASIDDLLSKFWELEEVSKQPFLSEDDKICEEFYKSTTIRNSEGRYIVRLPFKESFESMGPNRHIAMSQYIRNERSLLKNPNNKLLYDEVLNEYLTLGHMNKVEDCGPGYYLPHHGVFKPESTTTKLRVVFNASSVTPSGKSLNNILHTGPILQNDLVSLILRWRFFKYVFNADITKMYRQILIHPDDSRFQRILFRSAPDNIVEDFELQTVTFGVNCAPYLALRTLLQLAEDEEEKYPMGSRILRESMYVDDALVGCHSMELILKARTQLMDILKSGGFELRKFTANNKDILEGLLPEFLLNEHFIRLDEESSAKTLGIRWNASADSFYFSVVDLEFKPSYTKREVLSIIAKLFDPSGWLAPIIIVAKVLMQQMWLEKIDWDDDISPTVLNNWHNFVSQYKDINKISIPRWINYSPNTHIEFHGFSDASEKAYAAVLYARVEVGGKIFSNLLIAKTKVAPIKKPSIPRLELCGAVLLSKLVRNMKSQSSLAKAKYYFWSDSMIVLAWLRKTPCTWKTFVANRIAMILENVGNENWSHVISEDNPADLATRGLSPLELKNSNLWWFGPSWLSLHYSNWPSSTEDFETSQEEKRVQTFVARSAEIEDILERFSNFPKALRVIAYILRFCSRAKFKFRTTDRCTKNLDSRSPDILTHLELKQAREVLFRLSQQIYFKDDYQSLLKNRNLPKSSTILSLNPFLDKFGLIRANGRLSASTFLSYSERHPIILAYRSILARLYVDFIHKLLLHGGLRLVHTVIRQECWIIRSKILIKSVIHNCKTCILYKNSHQGQIMAPLPEERTTFSRPFVNTGLDFAGPFEIKSFTGRYCKITKGYACIFVCFSTKAIHLEAVSDLTTATFLAALSRFISRRGCPNRIYSDNGKNFVGAAKVLSSDFKNYIKEIKAIAEIKYEPQHLEWHFIPAAAPHMGGLWEAGVKSFKSHMKKSAPQLKYTFEEFSTFLSNIEACLNSRPLGSLSDSPEDFLALTPAHFLIGSNLLAPVEPEEVSSPLSLVNRWRRMKAMQQLLCRRWKEEYLQELHKRNKWKDAQLNLQVNDLVALKNEPLCPSSWRLGRVTRVYSGSDNKVRVVDLQTQLGKITRPIHKLVLIPSAETI